MANIVLVHGAWHGGWCWDEAASALRALGHEVHAVDLPGSGSDATPASEVTLTGYAERVADRVRALPGKSWLVAHSMGGIAVSQAAELAADRLAGLIYVAAFMPLDGQSLVDLGGQDADSLLNGAMVVDAAGTGSTVPADEVRSIFYAACSDQQVAEAQRRLRSQPLPPLVTPLSLSDANYGRVPRYYVECLQDRAVSISAQRRMYQAAGVRAVASLDTDHSPFYSAVPALAAAIEGFIQSVTTPVGSQGASPAPACRRA